MTMSHDQIEGSQQALLKIQFFYGLQGWLTKSGKSHGQA